MNLLTERLPCEMEVGGRSHAIDPDFRLMVELETAVLRGADGGLGVRLAELLQRFYKSALPVDIEAATDQMLWFYRCGKSEETGAPGSGTSKRVYDFEQDAEALYTSFLQAYQLDLTTSPVHWWLFRKLMFGLPPDTSFSKRLYYRTVDTTGMSREERKRINKLRALYAIQECPGKRETLDERNARMQAYVRRRFMETSNGRVEES